MNISLELNLVMWLIPLCLLFLWLLRPMWQCDTCSQSQHYFLCVFVNLISCLTNMIEKCIDGDKLNIIFFYKTNNSCPQFKRSGSLANTVTTCQELFVWVASFARELILSFSAILYEYVGHYLHPLPAQLVIASLMFRIDKMVNQSIR